MMTRIYVRNNIGELEEHLIVNKGGFESSLFEFKFKFDLNKSEMS